MTENAGREPAPADARDDGDDGDDGDGEGDEGGDPVCWASLVCAECGRLTAGPGPDVCEACGADFPG